MIYLDYNASTPIDERVLDVMIDVYRNSYGNADSRTHEYGETARKVVENSRQSVANLLGVKNDEVFFTSGATESDNLAILGLREFAETHNKKHIITTSIEHKAVLEPIQVLANDGFDVTYIKPDESGKINADQVLDSLREDTLLVSVMHANNETGVIQPVKEIGEELSKRDVFFHIDAAQSFGKLVDELKNTEYDMLSASAHKMYGPQGIGTIVLRKKRYKLPPVKAIMYGGGQEHGIRPGTIPTALIAGFGKACEIALNEYKSNYEKYQTTKKTIIHILDESGLKYIINGDVENSIPNTINIAIEGVNSEALMLASRQYCGISNGSACNANSYKPSHVLESMGCSIDRIQCSVRISWGNNSVVEDAFSNLISAAKSLVF